MPSSPTPHQRKKQNMKRDEALNYVAYVVDDAGMGGRLEETQHHVVRAGLDLGCGHHKYSSRLVGWECGNEPIFVAVHSHLDVKVEDDEAESIAAEYLVEIGSFVAPLRCADYIL